MIRGHLLLSNVFMMSEEISKNYRLPVKYSLLMTEAISSKLLNSEPSVIM